MFILPGPCALICFIIPPVQERCYENLQCSRTWFLLSATSLPRTVLSLLDLLPWLLWSRCNTILQGNIDRCVLVILSWLPLTQSCNQHHYPVFACATGLSLHEVVHQILVLNDEFYFVYFNEVCFLIRLKAIHTSQVVWNWGITNARTLTSRYWGSNFLAASKLS